MDSATLKNVELRERFRSQRIIKNCPTTEVELSIRDAYLVLAHRVDVSAADSREKSLSLTALEESCEWICKALWRENSDRFRVYEATPNTVLTQRECNAP
jgi:hypothetical protein